MSLVLKQSAKPKSDSGDTWEWSVWLDGEPEELDSVEQVNYRLHPSFPRPNRSSASHRTKFRITSYGWGEFLLFADVRFKDGRTATLEHWLRLREGRTGASSKAETSAPSRVFLSYTAGDSNRARAAKSSLEAQGIEVVTADSLSAGVPWNIALPEMIGRSDALVVLAPERESRAVANEVEVARSLKTEVLPLTFYDSGFVEHLPQSFEGMDAFKLKDASEVGQFVRYKQGSED